jgi:hypothetical protein
VFSDVHLRANGADAQRDAGEDLAPITTEARSDDQKSDTVAMFDNDT